MHGVLTDASVLFVLIPVRCKAAAHGKGFRLYSIATILIFLVFGGYAGFPSRAILGSMDGSHGARVLLFLPAMDTGIRGHSLMCSRESVPSSQQSQQEGLHV
jgi:hypothetical protein